jgi:hypothetical protein
MEFFYGWWRKLSLFPLSGLVLGWLVYLVGFVLLMVHNDFSSHSRLDYLPHYIAVGVPPVLVVLAGFHAALFGHVSAIFGLFAAILSVACFSGVGYVLYVCAVDLYVPRGREKQDLKSILMLAGTLVVSVSWLVVTIMWNCFPYKLPWGTVHNLDEMTDEDGPVNPPPQPHPFAGVARKVAIVVLVLKFAGWCVIVTGIDYEIRGNSSALRLTTEEPSFTFGTLVVCVVGILLILSAVMHAATTSVVVGVWTSVLSLLYIICLGNLIFKVGIDINHQCRILWVECSISLIPKYQLYQLCGGVASVFLWAGVLALWPFYFKPLVIAEALDRSIQQSGYYFNRGPQRERVPLLYQSTTERSTAPIL